MTNTNVRYISNGYIVEWAGSPTIGVPAKLFAASIPEVVYWLGRIFDPVANPNSREAIVRLLEEYDAQAKRVAERSIAAPQIIEPADDPLLGQQAQVSDIASGGFLVTQLPSAFPGGGSKFVEVFCANMDAVAQVLTVIYTPPPPPEPEA